MSWKTAGIVGFCLLVFYSVVIAQQPTIPVSYSASSMTTTQGGSAPSSQLSIGGTYNTSLPTLSNGQASQFQLDSSGRLLINIGSGVNPTPQSTSTYAFGSDLHALSSTSTYSTVKASAGNLYGYIVSNPAATTCWLNFYNSAAPTIGSTAIVDRVMIQAGVTVPMPPGIFAETNYSTAITVAATTTDGGSTVCSTAMDLNIFAQ